MTKELIDYHKTKMCLAGAEGRTEDYKFHKAAIELFEKLSLPSDLDEAANNYGIDIRLGYPRVMDETDRYIYNAFKAGAEWMAGQGVAYEDIVERDDENDYLFMESIGSMISLEDAFKSGDKVVVQIRKKD